MYIMCKTVSHKENEVLSMKDEKVKEYLMELWNFPDFDKEAFHKWQGMLYWHDLEKDMDCLAGIISL